MRSDAEIQAEINAISAIILEVLSSPYKSIQTGGRAYTFHDLDNLRKSRKELEDQLSAMDPRSCRTYVQFGRPGGPV